MHIHSSSVNATVGDEYDGFDAFIVGRQALEIYNETLPNQFEVIAIPKVDDVTHEEAFATLEEQMNPSDKGRRYVSDVDGNPVRLPRKREVNSEWANIANASLDQPTYDVLSEELDRQRYTIHAIAFDLRTAQIVDPFGGLDDWSNNVLQYRGLEYDWYDWVVEAASLASRLGFEVSDETIEQVSDVPIEHIPSEEIRKNMVRAFEETNSPRSFFDTLREMGVLDEVFPVLNDMIGIPAGPEGTHLEGDTYEHTMRVLEEMYALRGNDVTALFAALGHDFGKTVTDSDTDTHYRHDVLGIDVVDEFADTYSISEDTKRVMKSASRFHMRVHVVPEMGSNKVMNMMKDIEQSSSPLTIDLLLDVAEADTKGRETAPDKEKSFERANIRERLEAAQKAFNDVVGGDVLDRRGITSDQIGDGKKYTGEQIKNMIHQDRVEKMREYENKN